MEKGCALILFITEEKKCKLSMDLVANMGVFEGIQEAADGVSFNPEHLIAT